MFFISIPQSLCSSLFFPRFPGSACSQIRALWDFLAERYELLGSFFGVRLLLLLL